MFTKKSEPPAPNKDATRQYDSRIHATPPAIAPEPKEEPTQAKEEPAKETLVKPAEKVQQDKSPHVGEPPAR